MTTRSVAIGFVLATVTALPLAGAEDAPAAAPAAVEPTIEKEAEGGMQLHYTVETGVATTYVFRGVPQYAEKTDPSSMTTLSLTLDKLGPGALTVGAWIAAALTDRDLQPPTKTEIDLMATYTFPIGSMLSGGVGYILYLYPDAPDDAHVDGAHEFWASVSVNNLPVTPTLAIYVEPIRLDGFYLLASVTRSFPAGPVVISPWLGVALSKYSELDLDTGLNDFTATLPVKWSHASGFYAQASVSYAFNGLDDDEMDPSPSTVYGLLVAGFSR